MCVCVCYESVVIVSVKKRRDDVSAPKNRREQPLASPTRVFYPPTSLVQPFKKKKIKNYYALQGVPLLSRPPVRREG